MRGLIRGRSQEIIDTIPALDEQRLAGSRLVVTGCMAERYGDELAALPGVDQVAGFVVLRQPRRPALLGRTPSLDHPRRARRRAQLFRHGVPTFDLLNLPAEVDQPVGVREDRRGLRPSTGFCTIRLRGPQRSRDGRSILAEVERSRPASRPRRPGPRSYGKDRADLGEGAGSMPGSSGVTARSTVSVAVPVPQRPHGRLIDVVSKSGVPYFDLSLQQSASPLRRMRRWGDGHRFLRRIDIRAVNPRRRSGATSSSDIRGDRGRSR